MRVEALKVKSTQNEVKQILEYMENTLESEIQWTNSVRVQEFENEVKTKYGVKNASAVATGSVALEASLIALGVDSDSIVYCPVLTAPPTILSSLSTGAKVVYVDALIDDFGMDPKDLEKKIQKYGTNGVIIPVHIGGLISEQIYEILEIGKKYNMPVIEDCAHAHGSELDNKPAGTFGDIGTFSYFLTKTLTSGEGGMILTNNDDIDNKVRSIRNYGKNKTGQHVIKGSSWRMNEFTAAVALVQTQSQESIVMTKNNIAKIYDNFFETSDLFKIYSMSGINGYYKYILGINKKTDLKKIETLLNEKYGVQLPARVYENLCTEEPYLETHSNVMNSKESFDNAVYLKNHHLCLPIYRGLNSEEIIYVCECVSKVVKEECT
ncbi:TPA: aminotransferase class I/II-fold pyridoxal phosphate-dependent enzyme [Enterococcus faecalis]|uniref:DegT/DnrJ/EryC1/StrS family aminotransferase n=1 Tax=Enterococcus faecalis TaxID=1351 RepID=UPI001CB5EE5D|nr:DegT/DnrJ/EryC1/StrS family aminotransferase [Enterococcus faecalis]HBI3767426.1 aminotransferase class I/II-fold pyridoxal phosphate-dependent enzyme [Enterococcus faecalis]